MLLVLACVASADTRQPAPASQPVVSGPMRLQRPIEQLISDLNSPDPVKLESARGELMLLEFSQMDKLKSAARSASLNDAQQAGLREIVSQIFIGSQMPATGAGWGFMGVTMPLNSDDDPRAGLPALVTGRVMGCDAYRVLREGDTVVGMQGITRQEPAMTSIGSYRELRAFLRNTSPGDWILIRLVRNGEPIETPLRLGLNNGARQVDANVFQYFAEQYWNQQFAPLFKKDTEGKAKPAS